MLNADNIPIVGGFSVEAAFKVALVCKDWRNAIWDEDNNVVLFNDFICASKLIAMLGETSLQKDLVAALRLSTKKVKEAEYTLKRRYGGGCYNIFAHDSAISLFYKNGGWDGLEKRMARYEKRRNRGSTSRPK